MAPTSINTYVNELLQKELVAPRSRNLLGAEAETSNLMEQIALSIYTNPRVVLCFPLLARNALISVAESELSLISQLRVALLGLTNRSYAVRDTKSLLKATSSLTKAMQSGIMTSDQAATITRSIDSFLNGDVKKNVVSGGLGGTIRPSAEAAGEVPLLLASLTDAHSAFITKLYALIVSVQNFQGTSFASVQGPTILSRIKDEVDALVKSFVSDPSGLGSSEAVYKLLSYKAAVESLSSPPSIDSRVVDTSNGIPAGYEMTAVSNETPATKIGASGPITLPASSSLVVQDSAGTQTEVNIPIQGYDLNNKAHVTGTFPTYPLPSPLYLQVTLRADVSIVDWAETVGPLSRWYTSSTVGDYWLKSNGRYYRSFRVAIDSAMSDSALLTTIQSGIGPALVKASYFPVSGAPRFTIIATQNFDQISIDDTVQIVDVSAGIGKEVICSYSSTARDILNFQPSTGVSGSVSVGELAEALSYLFSGKATFSKTGQGELQVTGVDTAPGAFLTLSGTAATTLGIDGTVVAESDTFSFVGSFNGSIKGVLSPTGLVGAYDSISTPTGESSIARVEGSAVVMQDPLPTFSGDVVVTSKLSSAHSALDAKLTTSVQAWLNSGFEENLNKVSYAVTTALSDRSRVTVGNAVSILADLTSSIGDVLESLVDEASVLPRGASEKEMGLAKSILDALAERNMDRVESLLLEGKIQEALLADKRSLSFGGALAASMEDLARDDLAFPNIASSSGTAPIGKRRR